MVYQHIEAIPDDHTTWSVAGVRGVDKLAAALRAQRADAMLYKTLATLRVDCPITCDLDALAWRGPDTAALTALCEEIGLPLDSIRVS
jgi:hypothetical protein